MEIKILGMGCKKCKTLLEAVESAVQEAGVDARIEKIEDIREIMKYKVMSTPALVIDGVVAVAGRIPSHEEIKKLLAGPK